MVQGRPARIRIVLAVISGALLAMASAAGAAANQSVYNDSGSVVAMNGSIGAEGGPDELGAAAEGPGGGEYGYVEAWQARGEPGWLSASVATYQEVLCEGDPGTTEDDYFGLVGEGFYLDAEAQLDVDPQFNAGLAVAVADVVSFAFDDCTWEYQESTESGVAVAFEMAGTGDLIRQRDTSSFRIPGVFNDRWTYQATYRDAAGSLMVGDTSYAVAYGQIGTFRWSSHGNG